MVPTTARALYHRHDLRRLIDPQIVAIVGASETRGSFGERTLSNMSAFTGKVYAINPKYQTLLGRPAYRRWRTCRKARIAWCYAWRGRWSRA